MLNQIHVVGFHKTEQKAHCSWYLWPSYNLLFLCQYLGIIIFLKELHSPAKLLDAMQGN